MSATWVVVGKDLISEGGKGRESRINESQKTMLKNTIASNPVGANPPNHSNR